MKGLVILALTLVCVWTATGARTKDSIVLRVFNRGLDISPAKLHAVLKKANLEGHGYKLEVSTKLTRQPGSKKAQYVKTHYYYKIVSCDKAYEVEQELDRLLGGNYLGPSIARKALKDFKEQKIADPSRTCKSGIEVHYKNDRYSGKLDDDDNDLIRKRAPSPGCWVLCWSVVKT